MFLSSLTVCNVLQHPSFWKFYFVETEEASLIAVAYFSFFIRANKLFDF
jgi:hypothetical protein